MGQVLHRGATTTEAIRRAIQHSQASLRTLARRHGINPKTVAKWRKRCSVADLRTGPKHPRSTVMTVEQEAMPRIWYRKHAFVPFVRWTDCGRTATPRAGYLPSCGISGSTSYGNGGRGLKSVELDLDGTGPNKAADTAKDPHATYVSNIEQEQVRAAIQQLSDEFREIILLREYEELSYQEIATVLESPLGTVMSRLARARSKLRDLLFPISLTPRSEKIAMRGAQQT